jgi:hypothetical protein
MAKKPVKEVELVQDVPATKEVNKVTQEELQGIQDAERQIQDVTYQLGDLQLVKLNVEKNEEALKNKFQSIIDQRNVLVGELKEKYGDVSIDKNTGEIQSK